MATRQIKARSRNEDLSALIRAAWLMRINSSAWAGVAAHEVVETELTREDAAVIEERGSPADDDRSNEDGILGRLSARWRRPEA